MITILCLFILILFIGQPNNSNGEMVEVEPTAKEAAFWKWMIDNGAELDNIVWPAMDPIMGSRGVMAKRDIPASRDGTDVYVKIPHKLMMTLDKAMKDPLFGKALENYEVFEDHWTTEFDRLALYIIFQSNKTDAFFYPYVSIFPEPSMLADWSRQEMDELQDPDLVDQSDGHIAGWKSRLLHLPPEHFPPELFTWEKIHWAIANVNQRAFSIRDEDDKVLYNALVPGADLLNHINIGSHYKMIGNHEYYISFPVSTSIPKGTECYNGYGLLSNSHLLENYGFALRGNVYDEVSLRVSPPEEYPEYIELKEVQARGEVGEMIRRFPGSSNTVKLKNCIDLCRKQLKGYPTTIEDDQELVDKLEKNKQSDVRLRFAVYHRLGQKYILNNVLAYCEHLSKTAGLDDVDNDLFDEFAEKTMEEVRGSNEQGWLAKFAEWMPELLRSKDAELGEDEDDSEVEL